MTTTLPSDLARKHNAQQLPVDSLVSRQNRPTATPLKQEGARSIADLPPRFIAKIKPHPTGCWLWVASTDRAGYGSVKFKGRTTCAHLAVYALLVGQHETEDLDHTCRVRCCVNPAHLEPVSHRENMRRGHGLAGQNARKTHCLRGHEFTPENTRAHGKGNRSCKQCERLRALGLHHPALTPMPAALRTHPLGLHHPSLTAMPEELRSRLPAAASGARRVAVAKSAYAVRSERKGQLVELVAHLRSVKAAALEGVALTDAVSDGTLWGWRSRQALSHALGEPLANWDRTPGRTQLEREALVERILAELGVEHRGGWRVGDGR